jgi:lipoprotein-anchoring transpeptidase ErfK/SrfK
MRPAFHLFLARGATALAPVMLALAGLAANALSAHAGQDPIVIPGVGPAQMARPVQASEPGPGAYGGGFIDFLITGYSGEPRESAPRLRERAAPLGEPAAPVAASHMAALAPDPAAEVETREATDPQFRRQEVAYEGHERPGTIVIDTPDKFLFLVEPNGRALRYGIGVGRPGFEWSGVKSITRKAEWPGWTPPAQMMLRRPDLPSHMDGGPGNPLGARALYLGSSMYRIHGTNEPSTIGQNVSSGCIRMMNHDVIDLYNRVPVGTKVIVI